MKTQGKFLLVSLLVVVMISGSATLDVVSAPKPVDTLASVSLSTAVPTTTPSPSSVAILTAIPTVAYWLANEEFNSDPGVWYQVDSFSCWKRGCPSSACLVCDNWITGLGEWRFEYGPLGWWSYCYTRTPWDTWEWNGLYCDGACRQSTNP